MFSKYHKKIKIHKIILFIKNYKSQEKVIIVFTKHPSFYFLTFFMILRLRVNLNKSRNINCSICSKSLPELFVNSRIFLVMAMKNWKCVFFEKKRHFAIVMRILQFPSSFTKTSNSFFIMKLNSRGFFILFKLHFAITWK